MRVQRVRWRPSRWSLQTRVTAVSIAVAGTLLILGVTVFYVTVRHALYEGLHERGAVAIKLLEDDLQRSDPPAVLAPEVTGFSLIQVVDDQGVVVASSPILAGHPAMTARRPSEERERQSETITVPGVSSRVYIVSERVRAPGGWRTIHVGSPMADLDHARGFFLGALGVSVVLISCVVGVAVRRAVRRATRPVCVMSAELAAITGGEPIRRVTVPDTADEVSELADSINRTLRRLEGVVERQRGFVADVSHELRSPLTGLRAQLEVALEHPEDEDWPAVARAALGDADRLQNIVTDLLIMAKLEAGLRLDRRPVDLGDLAHTEAARRRRRVPIEVEADEGVIVEGTQMHLVRLLTNLLDNAERHAASLVRVTVRAEEDTAVLEVSDDGAGIPVQDRELVFRRFQRLDESRKRDSGGTGLGLPISREIAAAHDGTLEAADSDGGARLVLRLPLKGK
ncbi:sensor histidine kinase [Actinomadura rudentiformis]|uniref:histidine kinase n=1 Tax=Actinomadura rudentiformis TaxID=359158 RepID=A0A6H9YQQ4_9ACTN|nr:HAMP domain-containing sensor histidine kinase [Actinomadura rudentiformis]KAB2347478.1 HAMP domain-containing histidine kinase [Actinomadura rudentiformis]